MFGMPSIFAIAWRTAAFQKRTGCSCLVPQSAPMWSTKSANSRPNHVTTHTPSPETDGMNMRASVFLCVFMQTICANLLFVMFVLSVTLDLAPVFIYYRTPIEQCNRTHSHALARSRKRLSCNLSDCTHTNTSMHSFVAKSFRIVVYVVVLYSMCECVLVSHCWMPAAGNRAPNQHTPTHWHAHTCTHTTICINLQMRVWVCVMHTRKWLVFQFSTLSGHRVRIVYDMNPVCQTKC